ncbi:MAG: HAD-IA family hydrolase [Solirubrobacteraceae bacterium]
MTAKRDPQPRLIFLDALGTLLRLAPASPSLAALLDARHGVAVEPSVVERALAAEMRYYRAECWRAADRDSLAELRLECARIVRFELGDGVAGISDDALVATLLDALHFEVFDDVADALERWRAAGVRLAVVSNWDISLHDVLAGTGLQKAVDFVVTSAEAGHSKPDPAIFTAALARAGVSPEEVVHIGDSLEEDVAGARAAGIEAVLIARDGTGEGVPADVRVIATLGEW